MKNKMHDVRNHLVDMLEALGDTSVVAGLYGGGDHARAAGFRVPRTHELARA